jgi:pimeloyl-ACP methyl ester carboxylesterase
METPQPIAIFIHGFRAFRDWGFIPHIATGLANSGIMTLAIDFSMNVLTDKENILFDMDLFRKNTVTQEITEVRMLINKIADGSINLPTAWNGEVYLIGHSLGGAIAIMSAYEQPIVTKLVTICSICDFDIYTARQKEKWNALGRKEFTDSTSGQLIILDLNFLLDRLQYSGEMSLTSIVSKLNIPYFVLHTEADATVNPKTAYILANAVINKELVRVEIVPHGNHQLNTIHPFTDTNPVLEHIIEAMAKFLNT